MAPLRAAASPRPRRLAACALAVLVAAGAVACSSSKDDGAAPGTTGAPTTAPGATASTGSTGTSTGGTDPGVTSPSTLPTYEGTCAALADTYGIGAIQPRNTSSWVDERQRVVVDARREAGLLAQAQQGAPADVAAKLVVLQAYAEWLATTIEGADSFSAASSAISAYPDMVGVSLAVANVDTWRKANCPE